MGNTVRLRPSAALVGVNVEVVDLPEHVRRVLLCLGDEGEADDGLAVAFEDAIHRPKELQRIGEGPLRPAWEVLELLRARVALVVGEVEIDLELRVLAPVLIRATRRSGLWAVTQTSGVVTELPGGSRSDWSSVGDPIW